METLFRFQILRPPVLPDPRYPPLKLAQDTPFQVELARAAEKQRNGQTTPPAPGDPTPETMDQVANKYLAGPDFVVLDREDPGNMKLDDAATSVVNLALLVFTDGSDPVSRSSLISTLTEALGENVLDYGRAEAASALVRRLKDSIVALRQVQIESPGHMEILAHRLRLIDFAQKMGDDENFPLGIGDLKGWWQRTLLAPTEFDLQSILSTATVREEARRKAIAGLTARYTEAKDIFSRLSRVRSVMDELKTIPNTKFRTMPASVAKDYRPPVSTVTQEAFQTRHLQILNTFADLGKIHYETVLKAATLHREAASLVREDNLSSAQLAAPLIQLPDASGLTSLVDMTKVLFGEQKALLADTGRPGFTPVDPRDVTPTLNEDAAGALSNNTQSALKDRGFDLKSSPLADVLEKLGNEVATHTSALDKLYTDHDDNSQSSVSRVGNTLLASRTTTQPRWREAISSRLSEPPLFQLLQQIPDSRIPNSKGTVTMAGICDLLVVKQQLVGYEGADVAHIESVLVGEKKTREVTTRREVESLTYTEEETTSSLEKEESKMERFETAEEAEKTIKQEEALKAGITISASYGPMVKVSASAEGSRSRSKEESNKSATKRAQEITSKVTQKIQQRVLERSSLKITTETIDKTTHELTGPGPSHTNGVYQYVTKIYEAQTYTYGRRTMLDFMVPEPGAFLLDGPGTKGQPPLNYVPLPDIPQFSLLAWQLDEWDYQGYAFSLGATDINAPPALDKTVTFQYTHPTQAIGTSIGWSADIEVPEGYQVEFIAFWVNQHTHRADYAGGTATVGQLYKNLDPRVSLDAYSSHVTPRTGKITTSMVCYDYSSWSLNVSLQLKRTAENFRAWQFDTWSKLTARRQKLIEEKETREAQLKADAAAAAYNADPSSFGSGAVKGINPAFNEQIMRDEIKKHCISIMTDQHFDDFDSIQPDVLGRSEINLYQAAGEGPYVRFFEQAFEWDQMTWTTYPYFWGRKSHWFKRIAYDDPDPAFRDFMRAGFARANLPVRPGFEGALDHFLTTGRVWQGGSLPNIGSKLFLPIATEIEESLGKPKADEEKYGPSWTVRVPTSLITLRKDDKLPTWEKQPDGSWMSTDQIHTGP